MMTPLPKGMISLAVTVRELDRSRCKARRKPIELPTWPTLRFANPVHEGQGTWKFLSK
jgi:hypothetical protein